MAASWTAEQDEELRRLNRETSLSRVGMAIELGRMFPNVRFTPGSVSGRISRLRISSERPPRLKNEFDGALKAAVAKKPLPEAKYIEHRIIVRAEPPRRGRPSLDRKDDAKSKKPVTIDQLTTTTCRWPLGNMEDHPPYFYCGDPKLVGGPYCEHHCRLAYQTAQQRIDYLNRRYRLGTVS
jgi:GcrA cell cycle regulator